MNEQGSPLALLCCFSKWIDKTQKKKKNDTHKKNSKIFAFFLSSVVYTDNQTTRDRHNLSLPLTCCCAILMIPL
jgi:hypothetical protein